MYERRTPMWAETTKDGKTKFREQYKDPLTGKYKKVSVTYDKNTNQTRRKAQIVLESKIRDKLSRTIDDQVVEGITLKRLADEWYEEYKKRVSPTTAYHAGNTKKTILKLFGEDILVNKITSRLVSAIFNDYLYGNHPHSNDMTKKTLWKLRQMLKYGVIHEYCKEDVTKRVEIDWRNERKAPTAITDKYLNDEEYKKIIAFAKKVNPDYADLFQFLYLTGLRCGEAACLLPSDFFEKDGKTYLKVSSTLNETGVKINNAKRGEAPKTQTSFRTISLPKDAVKIYHKRLKNMKHQYVFTNKYAHNKNKILSTKAVDEFLKRTRKELGITKQASSHIFRHTHVSKLAELGIPLYIIQRRVGHSDSDITKQVYLHITKEANQEADSKIDNLK